MILLAGLTATSASCSSSASSARPGVASLPGQAGSSTTVALTQAGSDQAMLDFARCLRGHGVDEPDPAHIPGHSGLSIQIPPRTPATSAALDACNHFMVPIMQAKQARAGQQVAAQLPALIRYAQCMRSHDIAMLDPNSSGALNLGQVPGMSSDFGRYSPQFRAADTACRHLLPAGVSDDGTGP
jgi:hypothetical protein